jgi:hypothetical protein
LVVAERPEQSSRWLIGGAPDVVAGEADQSRDRQERNLRSIVRRSGFEITGVYKEKTSGAKTGRFGSYGTICLIIRDFFELSYNQSTFV